MIRLLVNIPPRKAGAEVEKAELGEGFAQQLLDAGQAVEVEAVFQETALDQVRCECFELEDQLDAAAARLTRIAALSADLDEAERLEVARVLGTAMRPRSEMDLPEVRSLLAVWLADPANHAAQVIANTSGGVSEASAAGQDAVADAEASATGPVDPSATNKADEGGAPAGSGGGAPLTDNPPTASEPSGDAAGASAPAADPEASAPKPAAKPSGAAKAKKSAG